MNEICYECAYRAGEKCGVGIVISRGGMCKAIKSKAKPETKQTPIAFTQTIKLDEWNIRIFLDNAIIHWRKEAFASAEAGINESYTCAICHIKAYQSVRKSLIGKELE